MPLRFCTAVALFALVNTALLLQQWMVGRAVNDLTSGKAITHAADGTLDFSVVWHWIYLLLAVSTARALVQYGTSIFATAIGQRLVGLLRERLLEHALALHLGYHLRQGLGDVITRTTRDADKVRDALILFWRHIVDTVFILFAAVLLLSWLDPWLGAGILLLVLAGTVIWIPQTEKLVALNREVGTAYDLVNQELSEGIVGVRVIKSFSLEPQRVASFSSYVDQFSAHARSALWYASTRIPVPQIIVSMAHVWVFAYGAWLVGHGRMDLGGLTAALLIVASLVFRAEGIGRVLQAFADARSSAARIWQLLDTAPAIESGVLDLPPGPLGMQLDRVSMRLVPGGPLVLDTCTLELEPGEILAVVGATGAGKSTLAGLLPRFLDPSAGTVRLGRDGHWTDARALDLHALRRRVHLVPQDTFLFADTLANNLRMASPDASDAQLHEALRRVCLEDLVEQLPDGLETVVGDRGLTLSGGQRQRMCLARALLSGADLLVLDDATSALDSLTEQRVLDGLRAYGQEGSRPGVLLITSKPSSAMQADRVVMLGAGRIQAHGTHASLGASYSSYRELMGITHA
jgi:ABC-type multidrug transport system fused ATPase/permease subunit